MLTLVMVVGSTIFVRAIASQLVLIVAIELLFDFHLNLLSFWKLLFSMLLSLDLLTFLFPCSFSFKSFLSGGYLLGLLNGLLKMLSHLLFFFGSHIKPILSLVIFTPATFSCLSVGKNVDSHVVLLAFGPVANIPSAISPDVHAKSGLLVVHV